ncbi:DinB family protein [Paenibacillus daejeonensis]|uniref:DinB family protein n=1 Tax=Paenibacillus daejeonensis TaxID=135193 RepID=UPI0003636F12|nr:DinB family protein [Paenibacillus daejeonensis]
MNVLQSQYEMIQRTRESLFRFCEGMTAADYIKAIDPLGDSSIRSLHAHVADCYLVWMGKRGLGLSTPRLKPQSIDSVEKMREVFKRTDALVYEFLRDFKDKWKPAVQEPWMSSSAEATQLWLFTHCITHEFHHRGQISKIGRQLGYIPGKMNLSKGL